MTPENVVERAKVLVDTARLWSSYSAGAKGVILVPWGGDFRWQNGTYRRSPRSHSFGSLSAPTQRAMIDTEVTAYPVIALQNTVTCQS